jgi:hypothetical protein
MNIGNIMSHSNYTHSGMSLKKHTLKEIRDAHLAHEKWVRRAKHLVENLPVDEKMIPLDSTECQFGQWFYISGIKYKNIPQLTDIIHKIEEYHKELHDIYLNIYKIYFLETKRSWVMSLLTESRKKVSPINQQLALEYYHTMEKVSKSLMDTLDQFEGYLAQRDELLTDMI